MVFAIHWHDSAMDLHVFPIPIPPPTSLPIPSLWVFPVHQPWALVSCIQPGLVICFTLDSILVSMLFSLNIPPLPSSTESKSLFCTSVSLFLFCIQGYRYHLFKFHIYELVYCIGLYLSGSRTTLKGLCTRCLLSRCLNGWSGYTDVSWLKPNSIQLNRRPF